MLRQLLLASTSLVFALAFLGATCEPITPFDPCVAQGECDDGDPCTDDMCHSDGLCANTDSSASCDDGQFCNGVEECVDGECVAGISPCAEPDGSECVACNEELDECVLPCTSDEDCDDGLFCTGYERCDGCACVVGRARCIHNVHDQLWLCDEEHDRCYQCDRDDECSEGQACVSGLCVGYCGEDCGSDNMCVRRHCVGNARCDNSPVDCDAGERCNPNTGACVPVGETCLSQCQGNIPQCCVLDSPGCEAGPLKGFADYATTLSDWRIQLDRLCETGLSDYSWMIAGRCDDGTQVLRRYESFDASYFTSFFDAESGAFRAVAADIGWDNIFPEKCCGHAYWPEKPSCDRITVTEVLCGTVYGVGNVAFFDPCRIQCFAEPCREHHEPLESLEDFASTRERWKAEEACVLGHEEMFAGVCTEGTSFLLRTSGLSAVVAFYDPSDGRFLSTSHGSDLCDLQCCGGRHWPGPTPCTDHMVTEVLCKTSFFADWIPSAFCGVYAP